MRKELRKEKRIAENRKRERRDNKEKKKVEKF